MLKGRFCAAEGIENAKIISDYKDREFGEKYGFLIDELKLLSRGVVVVDREGIVKYVEYVEEVTNEVNFDAKIESSRRVKRIMNINILAVGKVKEKYILMGIEEFAKRLTPHCNIKIIEVPDEPAPEKLSESEEQRVKQKKERNF